MMRRNERAIIAATSKYIHLYTNDEKSGGWENQTVLPSRDEIKTYG